MTLSKNSKQPKENLLAMANGLYLITGHSGSGKSTIGRKLRERGFDAVEGDTIARWVNKKTGTVPNEKFPTSVRWVDEHYWEWDKEKIRELSGAATNKIVFLAGSSDHTVSFLPLFKTVFLLDITPEITIQRVMARTEHDYGKGEGQIERILEWRDELATIARDNDAHIIDATPPPGEVVDVILGKIT